MNRNLIRALHTAVTANDMCSCAYMGVDLHEDADVDQELLDVCNVLGKLATSLSTLVEELFAVIEDELPNDDTDETPRSN